MNSNSYRYSIFDPAGNVTALVESDVPVEKQPAVAAEIMKVYPEVEQVGFVLFSDRSEGGYDAELRMAGGEFCGNASCCAAVLYVMNLIHSEPDKSIDVKLRVSGTSEPVFVIVEPVDRDSFSTSIHMPASVSIIENCFTYNQLSEKLPLVIMEGISHVIIMPESHFYDLVHNPKDAEAAVQKWCNELRTDGLGLMFLNRNNDAYHLTPLVFVPGSGTTFWENSCASGSAAVGMVLAQKEGRKIMLTLHEPGGKLFVECDPVTGKTILSGTVRIVSP